MKMIRYRIAISFMVNYRVNNSTQSDASERAAYDRKVKSYLDCFGASFTMFEIANAWYSIWPVLVKAYQAAAPTDRISSLSYLPNLMNFTSSMFLTINFRLKGLFIPTMLVGINAPFVCFPVYWHEVFCIIFNSI